jgi:hypothetical protein
MTMDVKVNNSSPTTQRMIERRQHEFLVSRNQSVNIIALSLLTWQEEEEEVERQGE